jgi:hypothetical protein
MGAPEGAATLWDMDRDEDAQALRIGQVARAHVDLDIALYLAGGITSTNRLVADCRIMVSKTSIKSDLLNAGLGALSAAKVVNEERNRVVHDMWLPEIRLNSDAAPRWEVPQPQKFHSDSGLLHDRVTGWVTQPEWLSWSRAWS